MKQFKKVVATVGKYTDNQGNEKNRYVTIGKAFVRSDGSVCIKIDSIPAGNEWNGWANLYDLDDENRSAGGQGNQQQAANAYANASGGTAHAAPPAADMSQDIPF